MVTSFCNSESHCTSDIWVSQVKHRPETVGWWKFEKLFRVWKLRVGYVWTSDTWPLQVGFLSVTISLKQIQIRLNSLDFILFNFCRCQQMLKSSWTLGAPRKEKKPQECDRLYKLRVPRYPLSLACSTHNTNRHLLVLSVSCMDTLGAVHQQGGIIKKKKKWTAVKIKRALARCNVFFSEMGRAGRRKKKETSVLPKLWKWRRLPYHRRGLLRFFGPAQGKKLPQLTFETCVCSGGAVCAAGFHGWSTHGSRHHFLYARTRMSACVFCACRTYCVKNTHASYSLWTRYIKRRFVMHKFVRLYSLFNFHRFILIIDFNMPLCIGPLFLSLTLGSRLTKYFR